MRSLLYTVVLDEVCGTTQLSSYYYISLWPCTGQRVLEQKSILKTKCNEGICHIMCAYDTGNKSGPTITQFLNKAQTGTKLRWSMDAFKLAATEHNNCPVRRFCWYPDSSALRDEMGHFGKKSVSYNFCVSPQQQNLVGTLILRSMRISVGQTKLHISCYQTSRLPFFTICNVTARSMASCHLLQQATGGLP